MKSKASSMEASVLQPDNRSIAANQRGDDHERFTVGHRVER
jgi:hypothetical protein